MKGKKKICLLLLMVFTLVLSSCIIEDNICYYAYFENQGFVFIYSRPHNMLYGIRLPLEQILLWGKQSALDSIPTAMRNYVLLKEQGFMVGSQDNLEAFKDMLNALGSESEAPNSSQKRLETLVKKAYLLSKKPLSDKMNQLCGSDSASFVKLLAEKNPQVRVYDAQNIFNTDDLNFSQRYFTQWLGQVLGGTI